VLDDLMYKYLGNRSTAAEIHAAVGTQAMPQATLYFSSVKADLYSSVIERYHSGLAIPSEEQPGGELYNAKLINSTTQSSLKTDNAREVLQ